MSKNYTEEEIKAITAGIIRLAKFWGVSALLYIAVFYNSTLAFWILGSLVVWKANEYLMEGKKSNDTDNRH